MLVLSHMTKVNQSNASFEKHCGKYYTVDCMHCTGWYVVHGTVHDDIIVLQVHLADKD